MKLSIIIINYNTKGFLSKTLSAIYLNPPKIEFETIVVDNASIDGSVEFITKTFPQIRLIRNAQNVGFSRATNQAIPRAKGEYILFLNPDIIPEREAITRLIDFIEKNPTAGCVGGKLLNFDGSIQFSCRSFPTYINVFFGRQSLLAKMFPKNPFSEGFMLTNLDHTKVHKVDWVIGACMLIKRKVLEQIGGFDERFFLFVEDTDLCYRLKTAGFDILYFPDAVFYHYYGASTGKFWIKSAIYHNSSMYKFFIKHYKPNWLAAVAASALLGIRILGVICIKGIQKQLSKSEEVPKVGFEPTPHF